MEPDHYPLPETRREHVGSEGVAEDTDDIEVRDAPPALALENTPEVVDTVSTETIASYGCPPPQQGTMSARLKRLFEKK